MNGGFPPCSTCGNTIRSRRCGCSGPQQYAPMDDSQMYQYRSNPGCSVPTPSPRVLQAAINAPDMQGYDHSNRDYLYGMPVDASDVYGSAISRQNGAALTEFYNKIALMSGNAVWYGGM